MQEQDVMKLLGKLSDTREDTGSDAARAYESLLSAVDGDLQPLLEKSDYQAKSALKSRLDEILRNIDIFIRYDFLCEKNMAGLVNCGNNPESQRLLQLLQSDRERLNYGVNQRDLPCLIYHHVPVNSLRVKNEANQLIPLSGAEYKLLTQLWKSKINVRDIVKSCAVSANLRYTRLNFLYLPQYMDVYSDEARLLTRFCSAHIVVAKGLDPQKIPDLVRDSMTPLVILRDGAEAEAEEVVRDFQRRQSQRSVSVTSLDKLPEILEQWNHRTRNCLFYDQILQELLRVRLAQRRTTEERAQNARELKETHLYTNTEEIVELVRKLCESEQAEASRSEALEREWEKASRKVLESAEALEGALMSRNGVDAGESAPYGAVSGDFAALYGGIVRAAIQVRDFPLAGKYIERMRRLDTELSEICDLYFQEASARPLNTATLTRLKVIEAKSSEVLYAKIHFSVQTGLPEAERNALAYRYQRVRKDPSPQVLYWAAEHVLRSNPNEARRLYKSALEQGYLPAWDALMRDNTWTESIGNLKDIADRLIPNAAYQYGKALLENKDGRKYAQGVTYLKIAAAMGSGEAVQYYADMLYAEAVRDYRGESQKPRCRIARSLFLYAEEHGLPVSHLPCKIGVLSCFLGDYRGAKQYLERDCELPEAKYCMGKLYYDGIVYARDLQRAYDYLSDARNRGYRQAISLLDAVNGDIRRQNAAAQSRQSSTSSVSRYSEKSDYSTKSESHDTGSSSCFITTATCVAVGKGRQCAELNAFRAFRDGVLLQSPEGSALVREYYRVAPEIVRRIDADPHSVEVYHMLYRDYILPGYRLLQEGRGTAATELYYRGVQMLAARYEASVEPGRERDLHFLM